MHNGKTASLTAAGDEPVNFADHEPGLWKAVITQALMDASSNSQKADARRSKREALEWLRGTSDDFEAVCDHAGLDPAYVRSQIVAALRRDCQWRLPAGQGWRCKPVTSLNYTR
jgi:hypothetical protein